jgi:nitroreductase
VFFVEDLEMCGDGRSALDVLAHRQSVRKYSAAAVTKEEIEKIVNVGRLAATARNVQPWHFVVVTDAARRKEIAGITEHGKFLAETPVCIVVLCEDTKYYLEDGCAAGAPAGMKLVALVAVGHPAEKAPRATKKELSQVLHWGTF